MLDWAALPYLFRFFCYTVAILVFAVIGHRLHRYWMLWAVGYLALDAIRYGMIVISAGDAPMVPRESLQWWIRAFVHFGTVAFVGMVITLVREKVQWRSDPPAEPPGPMPRDVTEEALRIKP